MNIIILIRILILLGISQYIFANEYVETKKILVNFSVLDQLLVESPSVGDSYDMTCEGNNNQYSITGSQPHQKHLDVFVSGPFMPNSNHCKLTDIYSGDINNLFFTVKNLPIYFTYKGVLHSCIIDQNIGTGYDAPIYTSEAIDDKLQGANTHVSLPCNGLVNTDTYQIIPGHHSMPILYKQGYVSIGVAEPILQTIQMDVKFNVPNNSLITSASMGESFEMACAGESNSTYPKGYFIPGGGKDGNDLKIIVHGPFNGDHRKICKVKDSTTGNVNDLYFSAKGIPIFFTYNGVEHSCYINQKIGTSYDNTTKNQDKLQAESTDIILPCNGLVKSDTYKITHGGWGSYYYPGFITIYSY